MADYTEGEQNSLTNNPLPTQKKFESVVPSQSRVCSLSRDISELDPLPTSFDLIGRIPSHDQELKVSSTRLAWP